MHTGEQKLGRVAVPQIVKADSGQAIDSGHQNRESVGQAVRLQWLSVGSGTDQRAAGLPLTKDQQFLCLFALEAPQLVDRECR